MMQARPLVANPQTAQQQHADYPRQRQAYAKHLETLISFYQSESKNCNPPPAADEPHIFTTFDSLLKERYPETHVDHYYNLSRAGQLIRINEVLEKLIALQKALAKRKQQNQNAQNDAFFVAGWNLWVEASGLAQELVYQQYYPPYYSDSTTWEDREYKLNCFKSAIRSAATLLDNPSQAASESLIKNTALMQQVIDRRPTPTKDNSRLWSAVLGTLSILASLATFALGILLIISLTPAGIGIIPGLALAIAAGWLLGYGLDEISRACYDNSSKMSALQRAKRQETLSTKSRNTQDKATLLAHSMFPPAATPQTRANGTANANNTNNTASTYRY